MFCHLHRKGSNFVKNHLPRYPSCHPGLRVYPSWPYLPVSQPLKHRPWAYLQKATSVRSQILPPVGATISNPAHLPTSTKVTPQTLQPIPSQPHPDHPLDRHRPASSNPANTSSSSQSASFPSIISASRFIIRTVHEQVKNQRKEEIRNHPKA